MSFIIIFRQHDLANREMYAERAARVMCKSFALVPTSAHFGLKIKPSFWK
jgi:hypothetical protein